MIRGAVSALGLLASTAMPMVAAAASPSPSPAGGDTRSPGEGPGFVGEPLLAIGVVVGIAILAVVLTIAYVRLTAPPPGPGSAR